MISIAYCPFFHWFCHEVAHTILWHLNSVSSQCVRGNRPLGKNLKTIPKCLVVKKKYNPPDFKFYPSKLSDKKFHHMV